MHIIHYSFMIAQGQKKYPLGVVDYELDREFDLMDKNKDNFVDQQEFDTSSELADADSWYYFEWL